MANSEHQEQRVVQTSGTSAAQLWARISRPHNFIFYLGIADVAQ